MADKKEMSEMTPEELVAELEGARSQLKKVNAESADRRKKLESLEKEKTDLADKTLSESEKFQAELKTIKADHQTLQEQLRAERVRTAILSEATKLNFANPEDAFSLIDLTTVEIADGEVSGFKKSLKALAESGRLVMESETNKSRNDALGTPAVGKGKPKTGVEPATPKIRV
jgi:chromosome segregation ATPase